MTCVFRYHGPLTVACCALVVQTALSRFVPVALSLSPSSTTTIVSTPFPSHHFFLWSTLLPSSLLPHPPSVFPSPLSYLPSSPPLPRPSSLTSYLCLTCRCGVWVRRSCCWISQDMLTRCSLWTGVQMERKWPVEAETG